jgi:hypothetical protein
VKRAAGRFEHETVGESMKGIRARTIHALAMLVPAGVPSAERPPSTGEERAKEVAVQTVALEGALKFDSVLDEPTPGHRLPGLDALVLKQEGRHAAELHRRHGRKNGVPGR